MLKSFLKDFLDKKIYDLDNKEIWVVSWVIFDINYQKVVWCIYKKWFLQYFYFLFDQVDLKQDKIFLKNNLTQNTEYYELIWKNVKNEDLELIWNIYDIEFDLTNKLKYIYVDNWYNFSLNSKILLEKQILKIHKKNIIDYKKDFLIVKDKQFVKENKKTLENIKKVFINIPKVNYNINLKEYE